MPKAPQESSTGERPQGLPSRPVPQPFASIPLEFYNNGGLRQRVATLGEGPLVLLLHGWPESWFSWRYQIQALAEAGYRVVCPDMRGYGSTDAPPEVEDYTVHHLQADINGLIDHYGKPGEKTTIVAHDWGAIVTWQYALLEPERLRGIIQMSVPWAGRGPASLVDLIERRFKDDFFYIKYFQEPGVAEAEFDAEPRKLLRRTYTSPQAKRAEPEITDPKRAAGGLIGRRGEPLEKSSWLSDEELDYYVSEFQHSGFRGGINYYRNFRKNWELIEPYAGLPISVPTYFLAGELDDTLVGRDLAALEKFMGPHFEDLRALELLPETGHWLQQSHPEEVNERVLRWLRELH